MDKYVDDLNSNRLIERNMLTKILTKMRSGEMTYQQIRKNRFGYFPVMSLTLEDNLLAP